MTPSPAMLDTLNTLLATDAGSLADPANALHVHLANAAFNPASVLVPGDISEATFTGSAAIAAGLGAQQDFDDPVTGLRVVQIKEPAGGWHWLCTADPLTPETIYGWYLTDNTDAVLYGSALFGTPVVITQAGQAIDLGNVRFEMSNQALI